MSLPAALVGHSKLPVPGPCRASIGTELCAAVAGLWVRAGTLGCQGGWPVALSPCPPSGAGPTILALGSLAGLLLCDIWGWGLQRLWPLLRAGTQRRAAS